MPIDKNADNIQVIVRIRPLNSREKAEEAHSCINIDEDNQNTIILDSKPDPKTFNFDWVCGEKTTQAQIFDVIGKPIISTCLEGYNCCIFAYGQTGAGKTFTMQGRGLEADSTDSEFRGLQPRVFDYIFMLTRKEMKENPNVQYLTTCSYLEIYNEAIMDLLEPIGTNLQIREDLKKGVYVESLKEENVSNSEETIELLRRGARNRHIGSTNMNFESSRSHSVFSMTIESKTTSGGIIKVRTSKFHFVDLAGSERQKSTAAMGERLKEAGNINKSLSVLGAVINSLVEISEGKQRHIRYRDSKLTFLLKDSLGGNSKTCIIANASPASSSFSETLSTLKFAQRAKQIKNKASINEDSTGNLEGLKREIKRLKDELAQTKSMLGSEEKKRYITPNKPSTPIIMSNSVIDEINRKNMVLSQNNKALETELLFKEAMDLLKDNELMFQAELLKKQEQANMLKDASNTYSHHEIQYRTIINLQKDNLNKYHDILSNKISNTHDLEVFIKDENITLKNENNSLMEILKSMPYLMKTYKQYLELSEKHGKIELIDSNTNTNSSSTIARQLQENLALIQQLASKLDANIHERKTLNELLNKSSSIQISLPYHQQRSSSITDEEISALKLEYNTNIEKLNNQIALHKQNEMILERTLSSERKRLSDLESDYNILKAEKLANEQNFERKIKELIVNFENMEKNKVKANCLEQHVNLLNIKNIELQEQVDAYRSKYEEYYKKYNDIELHLRDITCLKNQIDQKYNTLNDNSSLQKSYYENTIKALENKNTIILNDLTKSREEIASLMNKISLVCQEQNEYKTNIDKLFCDKFRIENELNELLSKKNDEILSLEKDLDNERIKFEKVDNDKKKLQEEYDTMIQTLNYNTVELEDKQKIISGLNLKIKEYTKKIEKLDENSIHQEIIINSLKNQIHEQNQEDSPFNMALKEVKQLTEQLQDSALIIQNLERELIKQREEHISNVKKMNDMTISEQYYKKAYEEHLAYLQQKSTEIKNLQQILDTKIYEINENEKELKSLYDKLQQKDDHNMELNIKLNILTNSKCQLEKEYQILNNKVISIQHDLESKVNEYKMLNDVKQRLEEDHQIMEKKVTTLEHDLDIKIEEYNTLSNANKRLEQEYQIMQNEMKTLKDEHNTLLHANQHLEKDTKTLKVKFMTLEHNLNTKIGEYNALYRIKKELEEANSTSKAKIIGLEDDLKTKIGAYNTLSSTCQRLEEENQIIQNEMKSLREDLNTKIDDYNVLYSTNQQLKEEYQIIQNNLKALQDELDNKITEYNSLSHSHEKIQKELYTVHEKLISLEKELDVKAQLEKEYKIAEEKVKSLDHALKAKTDEYDTLHELHVRLQKENEASQDKILLLQHDLKIQINDLNEVNIIHARLNEEYKESEEEVKLLTVQLDVKVGEIASLNDDLKKAQNMVLDLQTALDDLQISHANETNASKKKLNELNEVKNRQEELIQILKKTIDNYQVTITTLNSKQEDLIKKFEAEKEELQQNIKHLEDIINTKTLENQDLKAMIQAKESIICDKNFTIDELSLQIRDLDQKNKHHMQNIDGLREVVAKLTSENNEKSAIITQNSVLITELNNQIQSKNQYLDQKEKDLMGKSQELSSKHEELQNLTMSLNAKIEEISSLNKRCEEYTQSISESQTTISTLNHQCGLLNAQIESLNALITQKDIQIQQQQQITALNAKQKADSYKKSNFPTIKNSSTIKQIHTIAPANKAINSEGQFKSDDFEKLSDSKAREVDLYKKPVRSTDKFLSNKMIENESPSGKFIYTIGGAGPTTDDIIQKLEAYLLNFKKKYFNSLEEVTNNQGQAQEEKSNKQIMTVTGSNNRIHQLISEIIDLALKNQLGKNEQIKENEVIQLKEENTRLKLEIDKHDEIINKLSKELMDNNTSQIVEMNKIRESYSKLENQYQFFMKTASVTEEEVKKNRAEITTLIIEKNKLLTEISNISKSHHENQEKITKLTDEKASLLAEIDKLNKINDTLAGHNNGDQKIKHLNKLKEENSKIKDEKCKLADKANKLQEKNDRLQKKLEEFVKKFSLMTSSISEEDDDSIQNINIEYEKIKLENKVLRDAFTKLDQILNMNYYYHQHYQQHQQHQPFKSSQSLTATNKDLENILNHAQKLMNILMTKEKEIRDKELDIQNKKMYYDVIEKELNMIKQKNKLNDQDDEVKVVEKSFKQKEINDAGRPFKQLTCDRDPETPNDYQELSNNPNLLKNKLCLEINTACYPTNPEYSLINPTYSRKLSPRRISDCSSEINSTKGMKNLEKFNKKILLMQKHSDNQTKLLSDQVKHSVDLAKLSIDHAKHSTPKHENKLLSGKESLIAQANLKSNSNVLLKKSMTRPNENLRLSQQHQSTSIDEQFWTNKRVKI